MCSMFSVGPHAISHTNMGLWLAKTSSEAMNWALNEIFIGTRKRKTCNKKNNNSVEPPGISDHLRRSCNLLYRQPLIDRRDPQNHEMLASVTLRWRKINMHTYLIIPLGTRWGILETTTQKINLSSYNILILSSKHAKTSSHCHYTNWRKKETLRSPCWATRNPHKVHDTGLLTSLFLIIRFF